MNDSTSQPVPSADPRRYHAFDSLRSAAMLLGIVFHGSLAYTDPPLGFWPVHDSARHLGVWVFSWVSHAFRMPVFFVMSGFFAALLIERYGAWRFARHRFKRIAVPFVLGVVILDAIVRVFGGVIEEPLAAVPQAGVGRVTAYLEGLQLAHLWFLQYLIFLSAGTLALRPAARRLLGPTGRRHLQARFRRLVRSAWKPLWLAPPTALLMFAQGGWVLGSPRGWLPEGLWILYYGLFFGFGWLLYGARDGLRDLVPHRWRYLALALPVGLAALAAVARGEGPAMLGVAPAPPVGAGLFAAAMALTSLFTWLAVLGLTGVFLHAFDVARPAVRYLSDSAYWLYLAHVPIVAFFQQVVADSGWHGWVKFLAVMAASLSVLLASYEYGVRYTFIGRGLNGPRTRPRRAPDAGGVDAAENRRAAGRW